jgi:valyl-tRNA synthetase
MVNWDPAATTAVSDEEVIHKEEQSKLYYLRYLVEGTDNEYITIATTRPETILGDSAVCVNPNDERFKNFKGKKCIVPLVNRSIPIIEDEYVDMEFGTGALKITPAHDVHDYEIGYKHNLETIDIFNDNGTISEAGQLFVGMDRFDVREAIIPELEKSGNLVKIEDYVNKVGYSERTNVVIEPKLSMQWFLKMEELAKPALDAVMSDNIQLHPAKFKNTYKHWMENVKDWCISRQLWWGHRIPAYYCDSCHEMVVGKEAPDVCPSCSGTKFTQDEDVLDTWFSSALWPFSTLGWPDKTPDLEYFYPTNVLVTGYDIIFFWVVRMVFSGIEQMDEIPFEDVFIHGLVRDREGRKMSKSLGNGVDALEIIDKFGADALRFMLATGNSPGNDLKFQEERVEACRNFANKLWNASRFILMSTEDEDLKFDGSEELILPDKWIMSRVNTLVKEVTENMEKYELGIAANKIYEFVWNEYCDWYIEIAKTRLYGEDENAKLTVKKVLVEVLGKALKLLHPFIPYITEEIWDYLPNSEGDIIVAEWPEFDTQIEDPTSEKNMELLMSAIRSIRNVRAEMDVVPSKKAKIMGYGDQDKVNVIAENKEYLISLASGSEVEVVADKSEIPEDAVSAVIEGVEMFLPLNELIDFAKEIERLEKEKKKLVSEVERVDKKLSNQGFVSKAPEKLINAEKEKREKYSDMLSKVEERIEYLKSK